MGMAAVGAVGGAWFLKRVAITSWLTGDGPLYRRKAEINKIDIDLNNVSRMLYCISSHSKCRIEIDATFIKSWELFTIPKTLTCTIIENKILQVYDKMFPYVSNITAASSLPSSSTSPSSSLLLSSSSPPLPLTSF